MPSGSWTCWGKRLGRFGLKLHPDKTRDFRPQRHGGTPPDCKDPPFDILGFTHAWGKSRNGKDVVRQTTAKSRFARSLAAVKDWCRTSRHRPAREQRARLLRYSLVTTPTMASRETFGGYRGIATKS